MEVPFVLRLFNSATVCTYCHNYLSANQASLQPASLVNTGVIMKWNYETGCEIICGARTTLAVKG